MALSFPNPLEFTNLFGGGSSIFGSRDTGEAAAGIAQADPPVTYSEVVVAKDGSGDFEDIQEAINALEPEGGVINVREGIFEIKSTILIDKSNVSIIGAGPGATQIKPNSSSTAAMTLMQTVTGVDNCIIEDIKFTGRTGVYDDIGILLGAGDSNSVVHCWFYDFDDLGIAGLGSRQVLERNTCYRGTGTGISIGAGGTATRIVSNLMQKTGKGIRVNLEAINGLIQQNTILFCSGAGIQVQNGASGTVVNGNSVGGCDGYGVEIRPTAPLNIAVSGAAITSNLLKENLSGGYLDEGIDTEIAHNTVID